MSFKQFFSVIIFITFNLFANAQTSIYVDPSNGNDDTGDGTRLLPYKNIDFAAEKATKDKIYSIQILEGDHLVERTQTITSRPEEELIIEAEHGKKVRLKWNRLTGIIFRDKNTDNPKLEGFPKNITIRNLQFDGLANKIDHYEILAKHFWFQTDSFKNNIRGCATAINIFEGIDIKIDQNIFRNFWQKAVNIKDGRYVTVSNNIISEIGLTSLSGGVGIAREQWYGSFDDDDDPGKFRWDINNNLIFNVYQRIYSWVEDKGYYNMVIDEGKPIAINETPNHELGMKTRIHNNIIAFTTIDAMVFKSTVNLTISNNSIYTDEEYADAFTDRDKSEARYADDFPGFTFVNNVAHTRERSDDGVRPLRAIELEDAVGSSNVTIENNFAYGGDIRPKGNPSIVNNGAEKLTTPPFKDPIKGDFSVIGLPNNTGANVQELAPLFEKATNENIKTVPLDWKYDHLKSVQTLIDNIPGLYDNITGNETIFTSKGIYDISDKEGDRGRKSLYLLPSDELISRENISDFKLQRPHVPQYDGYYELILNPKYSEWYDEIKVNYKDSINGALIDYPYIRHGASIIRQDFNFPADGITVFKINSMDDFDITNSSNALKIDGDLLLKIDSSIVEPNTVFDLITSDEIITHNDGYIFENILIEGNPNPYELEIINEKKVRLTLNRELEPPSPFELISPAPNEQLTTTRPTFNWNKSIDNDPNDYAKYTLVVSKDSLFTDVVLEQMTSIDTTFTPEVDMLNNAKYYWKVIATDTDSLVTESKTLAFILGDLSVSNESESLLPDEYVLSQNYPNPFNPSTQIQYALPEATQLTLEVFNSVGQKVMELVNGQKSAGYHTATFDASGLSSGVYLYKLTTPTFTQTKKMLLIK